MEFGKGKTNSQMKKRNQIKFILAAFIFVLLWQGLEADLLAQQNVGIGTLNPDTSAILDVVATDKGMLIPRVALTGTGDVVTISSATISLLIYNTATVSDVVPGYYSWDGSVWVPFLTSSASGNGGWSLTGNAGTTAGANFIGTTDTIDWVIKTNNSEAVRVDQNGNVGIGTTAPNSLVHINGGGIQIDDNNFGIAFKGESPVNANVTTDGSRIYHDTGFFGITMDALVIEKTDINANDPDGGAAGIAFTMKGQDNVRETAMVIKGDGNVGIGTTVPDALLEVYGTSGEGIQITSQAPYLLFKDLNEADASIIRVGELSIKGLEFVVDSDADTIPDLIAMNIVQDGNVGIGTTNPTVKAHVFDSVDGTFTGLAIDNRKTYGAGTGINEISRIILSLSEAGVQDPTNRVMGFISAGTESEITSFNGFMSIGTRTSGVETEKLRITSAGNVGIGTASPVQKLHVAGNGLFSGTVTASCGVLTCSDKRYKKHI
ncbi:MAG: hypothetical protein COA57_14380, partial [Flavobacteriales bacterium]